VRRDDLAAVLDVFASPEETTISTLSDPDWVAVNTIIEESGCATDSSQAQAANAQGIVEYP